MTVWDDELPSVADLDLAQDDLMIETFWISRSASDSCGKLTAWIDVGTPCLSHATLRGDSLFSSKIVLELVSLILGSAIESIAAGVALDSGVK